MNDQHPMHLLILNGPNLNLLGRREPEVYGSASLADIEADLREAFPEVAFAFAQHNGEGDLIDALQAVDARALQRLLDEAAAQRHGQGHAGVSDDTD